MAGGLQSLRSTGNRFKIKSKQKMINRIKSICIELFKLKGRAKDLKGIKDYIFYL